MMVTLKNDRVIIMKNRIVHFKKDTVTKTLSFNAMFDDRKFIDS